VEYLRSLLSTPGQRQNMIDKALGLAPDALILDLEDGVPPSTKDAARAIVSEAVRRPAGGPARFVRVNALETGMQDADLRAVVHPGLAAVVLPKVERVDEIHAVDGTLARLESERGIGRGTIRLVISIESARGIRRADDLAEATPRTLALFIGCEDLARDLGLGVSANDDLLYARSALVFAAAAAGLLAIDRVWTNFHDLDGLRRDSVRGRSLGFAGKWCIHPSQLAVVNEVFAPSADEVEHARAVVAAFEDAQAKGIGAVMLGDQFVEKPTVERAQRTLRIHAAIAARG